MRAGIVACRQFWENGCPGLNSHVLCFEAANRRKGPLGSLPDVEIVSYEPCQACSVNGLVASAEVALARDEAEVIVFPSCLFLGQQCPEVFRAADILHKRHGVETVLGSYFEGPRVPSPQHPAAESGLPGQQDLVQPAQRQVGYLNLLYLQEALLRF